MRSFGKKLIVLPLVFLSASFFCVSSHLWAAALTGKVVCPDTNKPIEGAVVYLESQPKISGISDSNGSYFIKDVSPGKFDVAVNSIGFETDIEMNVDVKENADNIVDFELQSVKVFDLKIAVILVDFPDVKFKPGYNEKYFRKLLFDSTPGAPSLHNFYYWFSKGRLNVIEGKFSPVLTPPKNMAYYADHRSELIKFAVPASFKFINFNQLDLNNNWNLKDGPDKKVDHVMIVHSGDCGAISGKKTDIVSGYAYKTFYFPPNQADFKIEDHVLVAETCPLGSFCHEFMHNLAAQDLYCGADSTGKRPLKTSQWSLMDVGMYNPLAKIFDSQGHLNVPFNENFGFLPSYPDPWTILYKLFRNRPGKMNLPIISSKERLRLKPNSENLLTIFPFAKGGNSLKVVAVVLDAKRFYLINVRQKIGFDRGLRDKGVIVYYCDNDKIGQMKLAGPVEVRDAHPNSPKPISGYYLTPDYELDDAAFDLGEAENPIFKANDGKLFLEVLKEHPNGAYDVRIVTGDIAPMLMEVASLPKESVRFSTPTHPLLLLSPLTNQTENPFFSKFDTLKAEFGSQLSSEFCKQIVEDVDSLDFYNIDEFLSYLTMLDSVKEIAPFSPIIEACSNRMRFNLLQKKFSDNEIAREFEERLKMFEDFLSKIKKGEQSGQTH